MIRPIRLHLSRQPSLAHHVPQRGRDNTMLCAPPTMLDDEEAIAYKKMLQIENAEIVLRRCAPHGAMVGTRVVGLVQFLTRAEWRALASRVGRGARVRRAWGGQDGRRAVVRQHAAQLNGRQGDALRAARSVLAAARAAAARAAGRRRRHPVPLARACPDRSHCSGRFGRLPSRLSRGSRDRVWLAAGLPLLDRATATHHPPAHTHPSV